MTQTAQNPADADVPPGWGTALILLALLAVGAVLRFRQLGAQSLWLDEYWAVYLSTARDDQALADPLSTVLDPPPETGFARAPHWWHIWTGLDSATHPPFYYFVLRWWIDLLGDGDLATHALSAALSIAAIALMFEVLRPCGRWRALLAAGMTTFSPIQIYFAHETRPYALLMVTALLTAYFTLRIVRLGASRRRIAGLGICAVLFALTHYLAAGALIGVGIFAAIAFNNPQRRAIVATLAAALVVLVIIWGPQFWKTRSLIHMWGTQYHFEVDANGGSRLTTSLLARAPARLALGAEDDAYPRPRHWLPLCLLALLVPLWALRRSPDVSFWWLWVAGSLAFVAVFDLARHAAMLQNVRYICVASPGIFALLATPLPIRGLLRWSASALVFIAVLIAGVQRFAQGEPSQPDWREMARLIQRSAGPQDVIAFIGTPQTPPIFYDIIFRHYAPNAENPILLLDETAGRWRIDGLSGRPRIWVLAFAHSPLEKMFPGWREGPRIGGPIEQFLQSLTPPPSD